MIYFDNSATTKPCEAAVKKINETLSEIWGNPSSLYGFGVKAECEMSDARSSAAKLLNCKENEIFFTSGGTESNNLCIRGAAEGLKRRGNKIITTTVEHPSVLNTVDYLAANGYEVVKIAPEHDGSLNAEKVLSEVDQNTILISVMLVNNETGCIFPVSEIAKRAKQISDKVIIHSDCVQAFGKLPIDVKKLGVDLISASGHKIHGPKGVGLIYRNEKVNLKPIVFGGNQEKGIRSGTESVPLIAGFGAAIRELNITKSLEKLTALREYAVNKLTSIDGVTVNGTAKDILPYILNISVKGFRSETLLHRLEQDDIYVSSGSACSKGKGSYVLLEMGVDKQSVDSAIRLSFSRYSTTEEVNVLYEALKNAVNTLTKKQGFRK